MKVQFSLNVNLEETENELVSEATTPEQFALHRVDAERLQTAMENLPPEYREVIVLRGLEGLSYKQIACIIDAPLGTVMSRLSRARVRLQAQLREEQEKR